MALTLNWPGTIIAGGASAAKTGPENPATNAKNTKIEKACPKCFAVREKCMTRNRVPTRDNPSIRLTTIPYPPTKRRHRTAQALSKTAAPSRT